MTLERIIVRLILLMMAILATCQIWTCTAHAAVPGFRNMGYPSSPAERAAAEARVLEVYAAIDAATDDPVLRSELRQRCKSESWCNWYAVKGVHDDDASLGRTRWRRATERGLIDPERCDAHRLGDDRDAWGWWSTVGAFGTVSAFVIRHAGECVGPREMVDPFVAARLAVAHAGVLCRRQRACTCEERARWWAGPGRWDNRSHLHRLRSVTFYCGDVPPYRWTAALVFDAWALLQQLAGHLQQAFPPAANTDA